MSVSPHPAAGGWCSENLPGDFARSAPEPPLPGDGEVVVASSIFTHLDRDLVVMRPA